MILYCDHILQHAAQIRILQMLHYYFRFVLRYAQYRLVRFFRVLVLMGPTSNLSK